MKISLPFSTVLRGIFVSATLCSSISSEAQNILIPYKSGALYGLCDTAGRIVIQPEFAEVEYIRKDYFKFTIKNGAEKEDYFDENKTYALYQGTKIIIGPQALKHFFVNDKFIVASKNPHRPEFCMLYSNRGVALLNRAVKGMDFNDRRDIGYLGLCDTNLVLISVFEIDDDNSEDRRFSIAVLDVKQQKIRKWLVKDAHDFELDEMGMAASYVRCTFHDVNGFSARYIVYAKGDFHTLNPDSVAHYPIKAVADTIHNSRLIEPRLERRRYSPSDLGSSDPPSPFSGDEGLPRLSKSKVGRTRISVPKYEVHGDSLFYDSGDISTYIFTPEKSKIILPTSFSRISYNPVILKTEKGFLLAGNGLASSQVYDSIAYSFGNYIVCKNLEGKLKYGLISKTGSLVIPIVYDSLLRASSSARYMSVKDSGSYPNEVQKCQISSVPGPYYFRKTLASSGVFQCFQNGKTGLVSDSGKVIIPVQFDSMVENTLDFQYPAINNLIFLFSNGKCAAAYHLNAERFDKRIRHFEISSPVFKFFPIYLYNDYYDIPGLKLFALYNDRFEFMGYANAQGKEYFR